MCFPFKHGQLRRHWQCFPDSPDCVCLCHYSFLDLLFLARVPRLEQSVVGSKAGRGWCLLALFYVFSPESHLAKLLSLSSVEKMHGSQISLWQDSEDEAVALTHFPALMHPCSKQATLKRKIIFSKLNFSGQSPPRKHLPLCPITV